MNPQENNFPRRKGLGISKGSMVKGTVLGAIAVLIGASLLSTVPVSAHNIDLEKAQEMARDYARLVRQQSNGYFLHYSTKCGKAFPGHNHVVRCTIDYQNARDTERGIYTCRENIEIIHKSHNTFSGDYRFYGNHSSTKCGNFFLREYPMEELEKQLNKK